MKVVTLLEADDFQKGAVWQNEIMNELPQLLKNPTPTEGEKKRIAQLNKELVETYKLIGG